MSYRRLTSDGKRFLIHYINLAFTSKVKKRCHWFHGRCLIDFWLRGVFLRRSYFVTSWPTIFLDRHFRNHPLSMYAKFSEKLTFLTSWYAHIRVRNRRLEMLVFQKIVRTYLMDGPLLKNSLWFSLSFKQNVTFLSCHRLCVWSWYLYLKCL